MKKIAKILVLFIIVSIVLITLTQKKYAARGTLAHFKSHDGQGHYYISINHLTGNDNVYCLEKGQVLNSDYYYTLYKKIEINGEDSQADNIMAAILCESEGRSDVLGYGSTSKQNQSQKAFKKRH